jgi:hypothetical protein
MGATLRQRTDDLPKVQKPILEQGAQKMTEHTIPMPKPVTTRPGGKTPKPIRYHTDMNGCHVCTSHFLNRQGYPVITVANQHTTVARYLYSLKHGEIPRGTVMRHTCDNRQCINPDHLIPGTFRDNSEDMKQRGRSAHQHGEANGYHKLTEQQALEIISLLKAGTKTRTISEKYGITQRTVNNIKNGKRWKYLRKENTTNDRINDIPISRRSHHRRSGEGVLAQVHR